MFPDDAPRVKPEWPDAEPCGDVPEPRETTNHRILRATAPTRYPVLDDGCRRCYGTDPDCLDCYGTGRHNLDAEAELEIKYHLARRDAADLD